MQGKDRLSSMKLTFMVSVLTLAIITMLTAPEGAVSDMLIRIAGKAQGADSLAVYPAPRPLPDISFIDENGKKRNLKEYRGKVVVLSFWALWCPACKAEKPGLNQLSAAYEGKGLKVITLSDDFNNQQAVSAYYKQHQLNYLKPSTDTGNAAFEALELRGIPSTIVVDPSGREVARSTGYVDWSNEQVRMFLNSLLTKHQTSS